MQHLATLFISIVTFVNTLIPQANLTRVLGVETGYPREVTIKTSTAAGALRKDYKQEAEKLREVYLQKLQTIKDERKKTIAEHIDQVISDRNAKWVEHWNNVLKRLTEILNKIQTRADKAAKNGKDISQVSQSVQEAANTVAAAQTAVNAQAEKTYTINVTSEESVGQEVRTMVANFRADVKSVISKIMAAREAVKKSYNALKEIKDIDNNE
jgi:hypothetical protein